MNDNLITSLVNTGTSAGELIAKDFNAFLKCNLQAGLSQEQSYDNSVLAVNNLYGAPILPPRLRTVEVKVTPVIKRVDTPKYDPLLYVLPGEIGRALGRSARWVNSRLEDMGFQTTQDGDSHGKWAVWGAGNEWGIRKYYPQSHKSRIFWHPDVVELLKKFFEKPVEKPVGKVDPDPIRIHYEVDGVDYTIHGLPRITESEYNPHYSDISYDITCSLVSGGCELKAPKRLMIGEKVFVSLCIEKCGRIPCEPHKYADVVFSGRLEEDASIFVSLDTILKPNKNFKLTGSVKATREAEYPEYNLYSVMIDKIKKSDMTLPYHLEINGVTLSLLGLHDIESADLILGGGGDSMCYNVKLVGKSYRDDSY